VVLIICDCHVTQFITNINLVFRTLVLEFMALNIEQELMETYPEDLHEQDVPCAVCYVRHRASQITIPGSNACPAGWRLEYQGYLMAQKYTHYRTMFSCVDEDPDYITGGAARKDGAVFYFVDGKCGSLPCPPYVEGRELTCAVCTR
jgi:hypothetical protein